LYILAVIVIIKCAENVAHMKEGMENECRILPGKPEEQRALGRPRRR
jgi:hypothetical protein